MSTQTQTSRIRGALCILLLSSTLASLAASYIWDGGGSDNYWNNAANWGGNLPVPATTNILEFQGTTRLTPENDFPASSSFRAINFNSGAGAFTLLGNGITLASGITNNSGALQTLNLPLTVTSTRFLAAVDGDLTLGGSVSGAGGLRTAGGGKVTLTARNTYAGLTYLNAGMLVLPPGGAINNNDNFIVGQNAADSGALYVQGGTITNTMASGTGNFMVGRAGFGSLHFTSGSIRANTVYVGWTGGYGTALIDGGSFYCGSGADYMVIGNSSGTGVLTIKSGLLRHADANRAISLDNNALGRGEINMLGGTLDNSGGAIGFGLNTAVMTVGTGSGIVNINGGTLLLNRFITASQNQTPQADNSDAYVNFNGGTLVASASTLTSPSLTFSSNFIPGFVEIRVNGAFGAFPGGAIIDTAGQDCVAESAFLAPTGQGISELQISEGGSGYIGAPYVSISGDGRGATAIANMVDDGTGKGTFKVDSITVCSPGVDYTAIGTSFTLIGGAPVVSATPGAVLTAANTSGGLTKNGAGTLTLLGANDYSGSTLVNSGGLRLTTLHAGAGAVTVTDGAKFGVIRKAEQPVLSLSSLTLGNSTGAGLEIVLPDGNAPSHVVSVGTLTLAGSTTLNINGANFAVGPKFPILKYTTLVGDPASLVNGTLISPDGALAVLTHDPVARTFDLQITAISGDLKWTGTISSGGVGLWDINTTANWINNGVAKTFLSGANVLMDDTAGGVTSASLVGDIDPLAVEVNNSAKDYTISGPGSLVGSMALTKSGTRSLSLSSANRYTGDTLVNGGTMTISGSLSNAAGKVTVDSGKLAISGPVNTGTGAWRAGVTAGNKGTIVLEPGADVQLDTSFILGNAPGADGAITINGGSFTNAAPTASSNFEIGLTGYGGMQMSGGVGKVSAFYIAGGAGLGVVSINGGSFFSGSPGGSEYVVVGGIRNGKGILTLNGGLLKHSGNRLISVNNNSDGRGELNLLAGTLDNTGGGIGFGYNADNSSNAGTGTGVVNLNGGTLTLNRFVAVSPASLPIGTAYLNLNGATLIASASTLTSPGLSLSSSLIPAGIEVYVNGPFGAFSGGAIFDTAGQNCIVGSPLLAPSGEGISSLAVADGGSGYIGAPYVAITGDGTGATAVANMIPDGNGGLKVGSVTVSNPGNNYTAASTYFTFEGGAPAVPATPGPVNTAPNTSGGLIKNGAGTLTLQAANTYTGATVVNAGTLRVDGSLASSSVTVAGGALSGNGVVTGPVTVTSGALAPAGSLSINNSLTFGATGQALMGVNAETAGSDLVQGITTVTYNGTLILTNTAGTLATGQTFQLFSAAAHTGTFSTIESAGGGATWSFDPATGVATVLSTMATTPTNISFAINSAGTELSLTWPGSHSGWLAQSNAVNVADSAQWFDIPGSDSGTNLVIPIDKSLGNVFYRLRKP